MNEPVHILVTCRKQKLEQAATLIFKTLRVGFPDVPVTVSMGTGHCCKAVIRKAAVSVGAEIVEIRDIEQFGPPHDSWLEQLIASEEDPFWICDTDVVFWKRFEHTADGSALAGVRVPGFFEPWTGTQYRERLHTSLMRIDPEKFRKSADEYEAQFPQEPFRPQLMFVSQQYQPERRNGTVTTHFYDTLAMAWHAFGGQEFTQEQIESFSHLNCATYADLIAPAVDFDMLGAHKAVYENIENARGLWAKQFEWFAQHREKPKQIK
jgi:hypothetical protein